MRLFNKLVTHYLFCLALKHASLDDFVRAHQIANNERRQIFGADVLHWQQVAQLSIAEIQRYRHKSTIFHGSGEWSAMDH